MLQQRTWMLLVEMFTDQELQEPSWFIQSKVECLEQEGGSFVFANPSIHFQSDLLDKCRFNWKLPIVGSVLLLCWGKLQVHYLFLFNALNASVVVVVVHERERERERQTVCVCVCGFASVPNEQPLKEFPGLQGCREFQCFHLAADTATSWRLWPCPRSEQLKSVWSLITQESWHQRFHLSWD